MEETSDLATTRKRLKKALSVAEKLKKDAIMEHEVNIELAKRNDALRREAASAEERIKAAKGSVASLESALRELSSAIDNLGKDSQNTAVLSAPNDLSALRTTCMEALTALKGSLFTKAELAAEQKAEQERVRRATAAAEAEAIASAIAAAEALDRLAAQNSPAQAASSDGSRSRTGSIVTDPRGRTLSMSSSKPRRNSSIFVRLPDNMGTSLIRKSTDALPNSTALNQGLQTVSEGTDIGASADLSTSRDLLQPSATLTPTAVTGGGGRQQYIYSAAPSASFALDETLDISMEQNVSQWHPHNETTILPLSGADLLGADEASSVAIFEHFIVVGATEEAAIEFAHQLQCSYDEGTLSNMFKNTFGNLFGTNRFGNNATANNATSGGAIVSSSGGGAGTLQKQNSAPLKTDGKGDAQSGSAGAAAAATGGNRRRSFGLGGANAGTNNTTAAANASGDSSNTPVRSGGMFSYFMRSPQGTNDATGAHSSNSTPATSTSTSNTNKAGAAAEPRKSLVPGASQRMVKSNELDTLLEFDAFVENVHLEDGDVVTPGKPRPQRKFIYGDDNSTEAGSNSSHSSSDVLSALGERSPTSGAIRTTTTSNSNGAGSGGDGSSALSPIRSHSQGGIAGGDSGNLLDFGDSDFVASPPPAPLVPPSPTLSKRLGGAVSSFYNGSGSGNGGGGGGVPASQEARNSTDAADSSIGGYFFGSSPSKNAQQRRDAPEVFSPTTAPPPPPPSQPAPVAQATSTAAGGARSKPTTPAATASAASSNKTTTSTTAPHNAAEDVFPRGRARATGSADASISTSTTTATTSQQTNAAANRGVGRANSNGTLPPVTYVPNPRAAEQIISADKKIGLATTKAEILYRYPHHVEPPPQEVSDFCMPLGGKISKLSDVEAGTMVQEILFGHSHSKRSSRCFIFLLEDKTSADEVGDEETGVGMNRLYGICVLHPRLIKTPIQNTKRRNPLQPPQPHASAMDASVHPGHAPGPYGSHGGGHSGTGGVAESEFIEFESMVCYAFITRFPLFDFFFQVIFDLINTERLMRMELAAEHSDSDLLYSRSVYQYLPASVLEEVLARLTKLPPPMHGEGFKFHISPGIKPIESVRTPPPVDFSEHYANSAEWALPTLLSWLPVETVVWAMSLLLSESKVVVIGHEYGMVSCAVIGLLVLLRPLDWVSPVIPMLPIKLMDFVESPVPILVGITVSSKEGVITVEHIFDRCSDRDSNEGLVLSVLDVTKRELYLSVEDQAQIPHLCMPGAHTLATKMKECLGGSGGSGSSGGAQMSLSTNAAARKPVYTSTVAQRQKTRAAHDVMTKHIASIADMAVAHQQKQLAQRRKIQEMADRMTKDPRAGMMTNWGMGYSFGGDDGEGDGEGSDDSFDEMDDPLSPRAAGAGAAGGSSGHAAMNVSTHSNSSGTTTQSSVAAAFGKVLRPRGASEQDDSQGADRPVTSRAMSILGRPAAGTGSNSGTGLNGFGTLVQGGGVGGVGAAAAAAPPSKLIAMSKQTLKSRNKEEFLNRFLLTQIFAEHLHRLSVVETSATVVSAPEAAAGEPPLATVVGAAAVDKAALTVDVSDSPYTAPSAALSPHSATSTSSSGATASAAGAVDVDDVGQLARRSFTADGSGALAVEASPRNDLALRRRSVDMSYLMMSSKKAAAERAEHDADAEGDGDVDGEGHEGGVTVVETPVAGGLGGGAVVDAEDGGAAFYPAVVSNICDGAEGEGEEDCAGHVEQSLHVFGESSNVQPSLLD